MTQTEDGSERSKSHMTNIDEDKASPRTIFTPSNPREKTFDAVPKVLHAIITPAINCLIVYASFLERTTFYMAF